MSKEHEYCHWVQYGMKGVARREEDQREVLHSHQRLDEAVLTHPYDGSGGRGLISHEKKDPLRGIFFMAADIPINYMVTDECIQRLFTLIYPSWRSTDPRIYTPLVKLMIS